MTRTPVTPPCSGLFSPLLPRPGALGKLSPSNLHCPSGLLITEPSGPTDLYSHHLPRAPQPPRVATPPVTILQMKTRGTTWTGWPGNGLGAQACKNSSAAPSLVLPVSSPAPQSLNDAPSCPCPHPDTGGPWPRAWLMPELGPNPPCTLGQWPAASPGSLTWLPAMAACGSQHARPPLPPCTTEAARGVR